MTDAKIELIALIDAIDAVINRLDVLVGEDEDGPIVDALYNARDLRDSLSDAAREID